MEDQSKADKIQMNSNLKNFSSIRLFLLSSSIDAMLLTYL